MQISIGNENEVGSVEVGGEMGRQAGRTAGEPGPPLAPLGTLGASPALTSSQVPLAQNAQQQTLTTTTSTSTTNNSNAPPSYPRPYEGLPAKFVQSMKTLFDILDEKGSGLVPLRDIESRWARQANAQVIDHLRAVADQNHSQLLSFDRLCLALKMSLLADSPKSSCNNSVSSVTSAGSPAPPVSITGQTSAMSRGPLVQKSGTALSGLTPATATAATFENQDFDHRKQGSNSSTAGLLESSRFASVVPPPATSAVTVPNSTTVSSSQITPQSTGASRLPKFGSNNNSQAQISSELNKSTTDSGSIGIRAASVPPTAGESFLRQENGTNVGRLAGASSGDLTKLNSSFENQFDAAPGSRGCTSRATRVLPTPSSQGHAQQTQRSMLLPPSLVRPPTVNTNHLNGDKPISRAGVVSLGESRQPPPQPGQQQQKPGPPPGPSPGSTNLRRIVRPPSETAETHRASLNSSGPAASLAVGTPSGLSGRSRTPDNFLENSSGHQRTIKPPMMRSVSSIAESQAQKQQTLHGSADYTGQSSGLSGLPANRKPFPLPGLATGAVPVLKSMSSGGLQLGPPLAPPPARRAHSVMHEVISSASSSAQGQAQHHIQPPSANSMQSHQQSRHNVGANVPVSTHSHGGATERHHQQQQCSAQQTSGASSATPSTSLMTASNNVPAGNSSKLRENTSHLPTSGGAMLAPIQTEPVLTANKVMLGSGLNKVSSVKTASQMRCPPGSSHYGHMQTQQQHTPSSIGNAGSNRTGNHHGPASGQTGFLRSSAGQRDISAMVRAIPCQPATANVQQVPPHKQTQSQPPQQPQTPTQQAQFQVQQVPLRQMILPPGGLKPEKPPRRREPRRHTLAHGIEYGMIRRLKLLEEEREVLQKGLQAVERARDWYLRQVGNVQDKLQATSHGYANPEYSIDTHEERLRLQMARIMDVNHRLAALVESGDKASFPLHMNLALLSINNFHNINYSQLQQQPQRHHTAHQQVAANATEIKRLQEHNAKLSTELENRQGIIRQLETEKAQLLRELFAAKAQQAQVQAQVQAHTQRFRNQSNGQSLPDTSLM
ncbi:chromatin modification-related protein eaf-1-like isoform X4 [Varroa destructor]|uniref:Suppressor APC domain-containing protein n=1 Tax=Varroa destructor TaxID=109461 RepID=A0A7M7KJU6_VARDE|nr:chromatin modification-related protein eaf-1-like isoform X4 [Varroa destructor]